MKTEDILKILEEWSNETKGAIVFSLAVPVEKHGISFTTAINSSLHRSMSCVPYIDELCRFCRPCGLRPQIPRLSGVSCLLPLAHHCGVLLAVY